MSQQIPTSSKTAIFLPLRSPSGGWDQGSFQFYLILEWNSAIFEQSRNFDAKQQNSNNWLHTETTKGNCYGTIISNLFFSPYLQSYLSILSYQVTWLHSSAVLRRSISQSANTWLVHAFHYYIIDPRSASRFTHVYLLVYIVGLVAYLYLSLILLESPPTSVSPRQ